jgi:sugar phosphate isomerase/epimerase
MNLTRRQWLATSAALGAAAVAGPAASQDGLVPTRAGIRQPLSVAAYSYRQYLPQKGNPGKITLEDYMEIAAGLGLPAVEPTGYYFTSEEPDYVHALKAKAHKLGLDISGTAIRNDFCDPDAAKRKSEIAHVKHWIDVALWLGAPHIRVFAGNPHAGVADDQALAWAIECLKESADYAGKQGVFLGIENHGYLTTSGDRVFEIASGVGHEWLGVNLDTGNWDDHPYENIARAAPIAVNVQLKLDVAGPTPKSKVPADFARIFKILNDAGYRGYVALEYEGKEDPYTGVPKFLADVRAGQDAAS